MFSENSFYQITSISVENNGEALNQEWIAAYLRLRRGQNLMSLDLEELRRELERLAVVEKAEISRELPGRLIVRINERLPIATILAPIHGVRYHVDCHGVIMYMNAYPKTSDEFRKRLAELPRITGASVSELRDGRMVMSPQIFHALALIQKADQMDSRGALGIESVDVSRRGMLVVSTSDQATVKVGLAAMDRQLKRLIAILNDARQRSQRIATVDLTAGRDVPVTFVSAP